MNFFIKIFCLGSCFISNSFIFHQFLEKLKVNNYFICYSAEKKYLKYFLFDFLIKKFYWKWVFIGFNKQNGKWGLNFILIVDESSLTNEKDKLLEFHNKNLEIKKKNNHLDYINYAGIIPSILYKEKQIQYQSAKAIDIAYVVFNTLQKVCCELQRDLTNSSIFVIGSKGYIGSELLKVISTHQIVNAFFLDKDDDILHIIKKNKKDTNFIINVSRKGVIEPIIENLDNSFILINEVYPEPKILKKNMVQAFHIKGIKAKMYPSLPYGYNNALPCCALIPNINNNYDPVYMKISKK